MKITLDGKELNAVEGATILDVARRQGIEIPTLCFGESCSSRSTSCLVCLVKVDGRMLPACATVAVEGMVVESETDEVRHLRKASLELLLSDHFGDCFAPCQLGCPAKLDIPTMLRQIQHGDTDAAIQTIKETIPIPAVLGRICPKPCEKVCRRKDLDSAVAICSMKRFAADADLEREHHYQPKVAAPTGKRVVVIGAGPSGLSAAFYLTRLGHRVSLYGQGKKPGGRLRKLPESELPQSVLDAEIREILSLPIDFYPDERIEWTEPGQLDEILKSFDAVLLCTGPCDAHLFEQSGLEVRDGRLVIGQGTFSTSKPGVFATGTVFRPQTTMIVRSVADGREAAESVDRFLRSGKPSPTPPVSSVRFGKMSKPEIERLADAVKTKSIVENDAAKESARCLHCDCRGREKCLLLKHASAYHARTDRFSDGERRPLLVSRVGAIVFEPGKCIKCGLCVTVAKEAGEELGLAFLGRGFDVRIGVPFDEPLSAALEKSAAEAVRVCPTAALSLE